MRRNGSTAIWDGDYDDREADGFEGQSVEESQIGRTSSRFLRTFRVRSRNIHSAGRNDGIAI